MPRPHRTRSVQLAVGAVVVTAGFSLTGCGTADTAAGERASGGAGDEGWTTDFHAWRSAVGGTEFTAGRLDGGAELTASGDVTLAEGEPSGRWTSPWHSPQDAFTELVPSWQADTPPGTWIEIELQIATPAEESGWFAMGQWAIDTGTIERRSVSDQSTTLGRIATDTFIAAGRTHGGPPERFRLRITLHGDDTSAPTVRQVAAATSRPGPAPAEASRPLEREEVELDVPPLSQSVHRDEYPEYGGGGAVWCSPASAAMVVSYWGTGPSQADIDSLPADEVFDRNGRADGEVAWAALHTWDYVYKGAGNWPFTTAYAAAYGLDASVRRYADLRDVERWVRDGVPVIVSIAWDNDAADQDRHLDGASIRQTNGHIMVVVGFTADGDVIANDPAAPSNDAVRHVYRREQFERNWLRASHGTTYVIADAT